MPQLCILHPEGFPNTLIIDFSGEINNENIDIIEKELTPLMELNNKKNYIFDFAHLTFINSIAIGFFIKFIKKSRSEHNQVIFIGLSGQPKEVIELIGLKKIISIYQTPLEALQTIKEN